MERSAFRVELVPPKNRVFPQTVCLTLGVLTVIVKAWVARSRWRTEFVAIFVGQRQLQHLVSQQSRDTFPYVFLSEPPLFNFLFAFCGNASAPTLGFRTEIVYHLLRCAPHFLFPMFSQSLAKARTCYIVAVGTFLTCPKMLSLLPAFHAFVPRNFF